MEDKNKVQDEPQDETEERRASPSRESGPVSTEAVFNDSIYIDATKRLKHLDKGPVQAYVARGSGKVSHNLFALLCEDHLTPRSLVSAKYSSIINLAMAKLVASGPVYWPPERRERYVFIYENNLGKSIMPNDLSGGLGWKVDVAMESIIRPMIGVLMDLRDKSIIHGDIRPSNIFNGGSKNPTALFWVIACPVPLLLRSLFYMKRLSGGLPIRWAEERGFFRMICTPLALRWPLFCERIILWREKATGKSLNIKWNMEVFPL